MDHARLIDLRNIGGGADYCGPGAGSTASGAFGSALADEHLGLELL